MAARSAATESRRLAPAEPAAARAVEAPAPENENARRIGEAIRALREKRGMTQAELAQGARLAAPQLSLIERGAHEPRLSTLRVLAEALGTTDVEIIRLAGEVSFAEAAPAPFGAATSTNAASRFRSPEERAFASAEEQGFVRLKIPRDVALPDEATVSAIETRLVDYRRLEQLCGASHGMTIPVNPPFELREAQAEPFAASVRVWLGIGNAIVLDLVSVFEACGLRVLFMPLPEKMECVGFYETTRACAYFVIDETMTAERQLFCLARELAYFYLFVRNDYHPVFEGVESVRHFAKYFAGCFLAPKSTVERQVTMLGLGPSEWSYELMLRVKHHFGMSAQAFCYRLYECGVIDKSKAEELTGDVQSFYDAHGRAEPGDPLTPFSRNGRMLDLLERARMIPDAAAEIRAIARRAGVAQ